MTGKERILAALARKEPDRVPLWELIINDPVINALAGRGTGLLDFVELMDLDGITIFQNMDMEELGGGLLRCEWGVVWGLSEDTGITYPHEAPLKEPKDLDRYTPPDPERDGALDRLEEAIRRFGDERAVFLIVHDAFEYPCYLRGMERLLMDYFENPELAHRLARLSIDYNKKLALRGMELGAAAIISGDDYSFRAGPLMAPEQFDEFVAPYVKELAGAVHAAGGIYCKHTDGNIWPILDSLLATGIDGLDPLEPVAEMDIGRVKEKCGDRVALLGNVDCSELLSRGTPDEVEEAVKETIAKGSVGGGHIMASSNSIHPAVKPENYKRMVEATRRWGSYPLDERMVAEYRKKDYIAKYV